jgi:hypothetical protein
MLVRFSLDAKNFSILMLLNSDIDIEQFAHLQLFLSKKASNGTADDTFIHECTAASVRNCQVLATDPEITYKQRIGKAFTIPLPENPDGSLPFSEDKIATILWLSGIDNFTDLAEQFRNILAICSRKTKENTQDLGHIYSLLDKVILYLPNVALKKFGTILQDLRPDVLKTQGWDEVLILLTGSKYGKTMGGLFMDPPVDASGWGGMSDKEVANKQMSLTEHMELVAYSGKNCSLFPLTQIASAGKIQRILDRGIVLKQGYQEIHSGFWHPLPQKGVTLGAASKCVCGMPFCNPLSGRAIVNNMTRAVKCIRAPNRIAHVQVWAWFNEMKEACSLQQHIDVVAKKLKEEHCPVKIVHWAEQHGGLALWKSADISKLHMDPKASRFVDEMSWFVDDA